MLTTRLVIMGKTVDAATQQALEDVDVLVVETKLKSKSSSKRQFRIKNIPNGIYHLKLS